jgi:hypothetical protein
MHTDELPQFVAPTLLTAWCAALREWDWSGPTMLDSNLTSINRHYHTERSDFNLPPSRLCEAWRREGSPTASRWLEAKLKSILVAEHLAEISVSA